MYYTVKKVKALKNYLLLLSFENNEQRVFNMKPYLHYPIFKDLKNIRIFKTVRIDFDTIAWKNGADFDPEILYKKSKAVYSLFQFQKLKV